MEIKNYWNTTTVSPTGSWVTAVPDYIETIIVGAGGAGLTTAISLGLNGYNNILVLDSILPSWRGARRGIGAATLLGTTPHSLMAKGHSSIDVFKALAMCSIGIKNVNIFIEKFWEEVDWCHRLNFGGFHIAVNDEEQKLLSDINKFYIKGNIRTSHMEGDAVSKLTDMRVAHGGIFIPNECMVNPAKFFNGLITGARSLGISVISGFDVDNVYQDGFHWIVADGFGNSIKCRKVILCTGANVSALPNSDVLDEFLVRKRVTCFATPPIISHRLNPYVISTLDGSEIYRRHDNRIIGTIDTSDGFPGDMKEPDKSALEKAFHRVTSLYPLVDKERQFDYVWTKNIIETKDGLPIIGEVKELKNLFFNIGYSHHALSWQMIGGAVIAELLLGSHKQQTVGAEIFSPTRIFK